MAEKLKTKDPRQARIDRVAASAAREFAGHVIEQRLAHGLYRHWRCGKPNDSNCAFNVTTFPGRIVVTGDIGALIVERTDDMLPWVRGSIESIGYFAEKVPHEIPTREYDGDVAEQWVKWQLADPEVELTAEQTEFLEDITDFSDEHRVLQELHDSGVADGCDFPDLTNWKNRFLWCREALRWFIAHVDECAPAPAKEST